MRLVPSTNCPVFDAELAHHANVVLYANEQQLVLLKYSLPFGVWYVCGFRSVQAAVDETAPDASYYWRWVGYVEEPTYNYALLQHPPARAEDEWVALYDTIVDRIITQSCGKREA